MSRLGIRVVFVGAATWDAIALAKEFPGPDERIVAERMEYAGGGPAATAAVTAARLGLSPAFVGAVGDGDEGERILAGLRREGVDVSDVARVRAGQSGASVVLVHATRGTRAICTRPVPSFELGSAAAERVRAADWVHVDHLGWGPVSRLLTGTPPAARPRISVDAGNPIGGFSAAAVDLFAPTLPVLVATYGGGEIDTLLDAALEDGAECVVTTRGRDGSSGATADGVRVHAPGYPVDAVSTLGAGDVFHGALLAGIARGYGLADQLAYANAVAALSCRGLDGRSAIPSHHEARQLCTTVSTATSVESR